jgi:uncharacterized RmlC-like cupin family protein
MPRNAVIIGVSTVIVAYAASAQTIQFSTLDEAGAERVLQVALPAFIPHTEINVSKVLPFHLVVVRSTPAPIVGQPS